VNASAPIDLDRIDAGTRSLLRRFGFDEALFGELRARVAAGELRPESNVVRGTVEPPPEDAIERLPAPDETGYDQARETGLQALRAGEVAVAVLNGGMATRFGGRVKGIVEAVDGRSFLEWKLLDAARAAQVVGAPVPFVVMNSFQTDAPTRAWFEERGGDGLPDPIFFSQFISLRLRPDGSLFLDREGRPSPYGPGHGDFAFALRASGTLERLRERGVRLLALSNVDNLGARVDPAVLGLHRLRGRAMTAEVADKREGDAGGAPARLDGHTMLLEGFRFPPDFDASRIPVFATNSFVFELDALAEDYPLTWFCVHKEVDGRPAVQLERLVNELSTFLSTTYLAVRRTGPRGRFFPIKTPADLERSGEGLAEMLHSSVLN